MFNFFKFYLLFYLIAFFGFFVLPAYGAPDIVSAPNNVSDGTNITISGSAFGAGAIVYKWDDFEINNNFSGWKLNPAVTASYTNSNQRMGSLQSAYGSTGGEDISYDSSTPIPEMYISFWIKRGYSNDPWLEISDPNYVDPADPLGINGNPKTMSMYNWKWLHITSNNKDQPGWIIDDMWPSCFDPTKTYSNCTEGFTVVDGVGTCNDPDLTYPWCSEVTMPVTSNVSVMEPNGNSWAVPPGFSSKDNDGRSFGYGWSRIDAWAKESSAPGGIFDGIEDGFLKIWYDLSSKEDITGIRTNIPGNANHWQEITILAWNRGPAEDIHSWIDDVYISSSPARIEIGDNPNWNSCTHREIQIPTAWSDGSATITVNQGSFTNGTAYLFVVDESGEASQGYPITFNGNYNTIAPSSPSGLSII